MYVQYIYRTIQNISRFSPTEYTFFTFQYTCSWFNLTEVIYINKSDGMNRNSLKTNTETQKNKHKQVKTSQQKIPRHCHAGLTHDIK